MRDHWVISRPKRKLILVPDMLRIFAAVVEGKKWKGNREIQLQFEIALTEAQWKAQNISADGSGARTYAVLLFMFGLWYEDEENGVCITLAGEEILGGALPVPIITKQLLDFQYPSPYSLNRNVNISHDFKIQPYRFILNLFLQEGFEEVTQNEIAYCLVPFAKNSNDLEKCADLVREFRENSNRIISNAVESSGTTEDNLRNIGNTVVNQLEYTGYFLEKQDIKSLRIKPESTEIARSVLNRLRSGLIQDPNDVASFQKRYGTGLDTTKDYSSSIREPMPISPNERLIFEKFYILSSNEPIFSLTPEIIARLSNETGAGVSMVGRVLDRMPLETQASQFYSNYLSLSVGGRSTAEDFERKTAALFEGFGIDTLWVGRKPRHPDVIVFIDKVNMKHGIIDAKAYREYSLSLDHKNKMAHTYIPDFKQFMYDDDNYKLSFFGYVSGGYSSNISNSFEELLSMTDVSGFFISAKNLLDLLKNHHEHPFSTEELLEIFSSGQELRAYEIRN